MKIKKIKYFCTIKVIQYDIIWNSITNSLLFPFFLAVAFIKKGYFLCQKSLNHHWTNHNHPKYFLSGGLYFESAISDPNLNLLKYTEDHIQHAQLLLRKYTAETI